MGYLLDTCACIWLAEDEPLSEAAYAAIDESFQKGNSVYISPFTAWEIGMLMARGRLISSVRAEVWFERLLTIEGVALADLSPNILLASSFLPGEPPRDPADRIIISTAREMGLSVITRDSLILGYAEAGYVRAVAC